MNEPHLTCDVGTVDVDGRPEIDGDSDGALVGQIDTLFPICSFEKRHYQRRKTHI